MLKSKLEKCTEKELDLFIEKLERDRRVIFEESGDEGWIKREYWYISKSYLSLGCHEKFNKYKKMAYEHLILQSKLIEDEKIRNDYISLPLLHRLLQEEDVPMGSNIKDDSDKKLLITMESDKKNKIEAATKMMMCINCDTRSVANEGGCLTCQSCGWSKCD